MSRKVVVTATIFSFSGKLNCVIDESPENYISIQSTKQPMTSSEFNKKLTVEKELIKSDMIKFANLEFDRTGYFLFYPSMIGEYLSASKPLVFKFLLIWRKQLDEAYRPTSSASSFC